MNWPGKATIIKRFCGLSVVQLTVPLDSNAAYFLARGGWIVDEDGEPFIIRHVLQTEAEATITAHNPHAGLMSRITVPAPGAYAVAATGSADEVIKAFVSASLRGLEWMTVAAGRAGGSTISDQSRFRNLGDEVVRIAAAAGLGLQFRRVGTDIVFDTYPGVDRTVGNAADNAPCMFSIEYKNLQGHTFADDGTGEQTTVYVGGAGEGIAREVALVGDATTGWARREVFADARDVDAGDAATLAERAAQNVIPAQASVTAKVSADANLVYGTHYGLGDLVTVYIPERSYTWDGEYVVPVERRRAVNARVIEATIAYSGSARTVTLTLGDAAQRSVAASTRQEIATLKAI